MIHYGPNPCFDWTPATTAAATNDDTMVDCPECRRLNAFALTTLTDGTQVYPEHATLKANGQQQDYVVLSESERARGFVRPFRDAYRHQKCGQITTMSRSIGETYARDPSFYSGTFCVTCGGHFPVGERGEFTWYEMDGREGPKVGT
jgi:hypothetical protein